VEQREYPRRSAGQTSYDGPSIVTRLQPFILLLFVGSGAAALIYEIVWFQVLTLALGSSAFSVGVLLATFMGGMCLGSLLLPRLVSPDHHPLRVYAWLEIAIGVSGLLLLVVMPLAGQVYTSWGGYGFTGFALRGLVASICLLPPTMAMGATLPAVSRWVESTPAGVAWLGFFYAGNIAGAVAGTLLAGFYLLRVYDVSIATFVAAGLNTSVALLSLLIASRVLYSPATATSRNASTSAEALVDEHAQPRESGSAVPIYISLALSGACAMAAQVIWTRQMALIFGGTVYTFSLVLAVFLVGLGIGSSVGSALARSVRRIRLAFGWCQALTVLAMAWSAYMLNGSLPFWPVNPELSTDIWRTFHLDLARASWAVFPAPLLWGASFPLAIAATVRKGDDSGRVVGGLYAANTLGAIVGSLAASLVLVMWLGSQRALQILMVAAAVSGLIVLLAASKSRAIAVAGLAISIVTALLIQTVPPVPGLLVAYGRRMATMLSGPPDIVYMGEGLNSSVAVSQFSGGVTNYHNAGKIQASSLPQDMRLQRMLGHLTTLSPKQARSVLVIGCGAGVTAGAVSVDPNVERLTIAEIEPLVPEVVSTYFGDFNFNVVSNPKTRVIVDDARHYLLTTDEKFDAITSDPLDPWVKGAAALYTREFWELAKQRLNPGGVVTVFVQLYESSPEAVKSEIATFFEAFPNGVIFGNEFQGEGYDTVLLGQLESGPIDVAAINRRLNEPGFEMVRQSLSEVGFPSAFHLYGSYAGRASEMGGYLAGAPINYDRNLRLQYLAGLGLNLRAAGSIYLDIVQYRRFPEGLFLGSDGDLAYMRQLIEQRGEFGTP
jgi:spermidine synthase